MRPEIFFIKEIWQRLLPDLPPLTRKEAGSLFKRSGENLYACVWTIWRLHQRIAARGPVDHALRWIYGLAPKYTDECFYDIPANLLPEERAEAA